MANVKQLPPVELDADTAVEGSLAWATLHGTRLDRMRAMRSRLAAQIDSEHTLARDLAALVRRFAELDKEISELEAVEESLEVEEVADHDIGDTPFDPASV